MKFDLERTLKRIRNNPPPHVAFIEDWNWQDVRLIAAHKRDLFSYDLIYLEIQFANGTSRVIDEQHAGFVDLMERMRRIFPAIPPNWYSEIMVPAFETKLTVLYEQKLKG